MFDAWAFNTWFFGRPELADFFGLGGPGGPQKPFQKEGGLVWFFVATGAAQNPKIDDFRPKPLLYVYVKTIGSLMLTSGLSWNVNFWGRFRLLFGGFGAVSGRPGRFPQICDPPRH